MLIHPESKTKIVATVGPACDSQTGISRLVDLGVNVFRFNTKHSDVDWHRERIQRVIRVAEKKKKAIGVMIDIQGPEIRIKTEGDKDMRVRKGDEIAVATKVQDKYNTITVNHSVVIESLKKGDTVLIDDGLQVFTATKKAKNYLLIRAHDDYVIQTNKSMNLPGIDVELPLLSKKDKEYIDLAMNEAVCYIALSFVRSENDVWRLRRELKKRKLKTKIISKIENASALENIHEIIDATDGVMIARGDLGVETPLEELAYWQKEIISECRIVGRPVITATQMLQSMIDNPIPTRAEATDVSNAVFDATDAIMLSGETASGAYPAEAVDMMHRIAMFSEKMDAAPPLFLEGEFTQTDTLAHAAIDIIQQTKKFEIDAVVVFTESGRTARAISRFRPNVPVFAITPDEEILHELTLFFGIEPLMVDLKRSELTSTGKMANLLKGMQKVKKGHRLLFVHGDRWKEPGQTNTISIKEVL